MEKSIKKIIKWVLEYLDMDSEEARDLIYKTGMAESGYRALEGYGANPAIGYWQVEPATMYDTIDNYINYRPELKTKIYGIGYESIISGLILLSFSIPIYIYQKKYA